MKHLLIRIAAAVALAATGLVAAHASSASAGSTSQEYNISGDVPNEPGWGESFGEVLFGSYGFSFLGAVRDRCPADGKGMEVRARVEFLNGDLGWRNNLVQDLNGCGTAWEDNGNYPIEYAYDRRVARVQIQLWATNDGDPYVKIAQSTWKNNPNYP